MTKRRLRARTRPAAHARAEKAPHQSRRAARIGVAVVVAVAGGLALARLVANRPQDVVTPTSPATLHPRVAELVDAQLARVREKPESTEARGELCLTYEANRLWVEAEKCFAQVAALAPDEPLWALHRAVTLREAGNVVDAAGLVRELAVAHPADAAIQDRAGSILLEVGDLAGAGAAYEREIAAAPKVPLGYAGLGDVKLRAGDTDEAVRLLEQAVRLDPGYRHPRHALGLAYRAAGRAAEAEQQLALGSGSQRALLRDRLSNELDRLTRYPGQLRRQAQDLLAAGRLPETEAIYARLVADDPADIESRLDLAEVRRRQGRTGEALSLLEETLRIDAGHRTHARLAAMLALLGRTQEALEHADRALAIAPEDVVALAAHARALVASGRVAEALPAFEKASRGSTNARLHFDHGEALARLGRMEEARVAFERSADLAPDAPLPRLRHAEVALELGRLDEAERAAGLVAGLRPDDPKLAALRARLAAARGERGGP